MCMHACVHVSMPHIVVHACDMHLTSHSACIIFAQTCMLVFNLLTYHTRFGNIVRMSIS